jgi:Holliday junction resolvase RusA-like endonuclease
MSAKNKIVFSFDLPTLNDYINTERTNRFKAAQIKKKATQNAFYACIESGLKLEDALYDLSVYWIVANNRRDADNIYFGIKFILDGVVKAGVLKGDGRINIRNISHLIRTVKDKNICVVVFEKVCKVDKKL